MTPGGACYVLPLRWQADDDAGELTAYLRRLAGLCQVVVVDGSPDAVFARHHRAWAPFACHLRPDPDLAYRNGKVNGVITGLRAAGGDRVIIADDDVRYDGPALAQVFALLDDADLVIPQNYFSPLPWHAAWDTARTLLNRAFGMDYPGTMAVRRTAFLRARCYDGNVLFENLELIRTMRAAGARVTVAPQAYVRRLPPTARHFAGQRVRQAYDSLGQPPRLALELALLPAAAFAAGTAAPRCSPRCARSWPRPGWPSGQSAAGSPWPAGCAAASATPAAGCRGPRRPPPSCAARTSWAPPGARKPVRACVPSQN